MSKRGEPPDKFVKVRQQPECEKAADETNTRIVRLVSYAVCRRRKNGHARFKPGELRALLGMSTKGSHGMARLIERAVLTKQLAPGSWANCLIPENAEGGIGGSQYAKCACQDQHDRVAVKHFKLLNKEQESRAEKNARNERERRTREEVDGMVDASFTITNEEAAMVLLARKEAAAAKRREAREAAKMQNLAVVIPLRKREGR